MIPTLAYTIDVFWALGPLGVYLLTLIIICVLLLTRSSRRQSIGYTSAIGALAGTVYSALLFITLYVNREVALPMFYVFYAIFITFTFIPGLIAFAKISKQKGDRLGKFVLGFSYLWALAVMVIGLAMAITLGVNLNSSDASFFEGSGYTHFSKLYIFLVHSPWAFVATYLILLGAYSSSLTGKKPKMTLIVYSVLNMIAVLVLTICINITTDDSNLYVTLTLIYSFLLALSDIPYAIALIISTCYGHLWVTESGVKEDPNTHVNQVDIEKN